MTYTAVNQVILSLTAIHSFIHSFIECARQQQYITIII